MTSPLNQDVLDALFREDLSAFIAKAFQIVSPADSFLPNWHIDLLADHLMRCHRGEIKRLIITVPPRSLKSICASVAFPAWVLGKDPSRRIICASYSSELAAKLARDCKAVMESEFYRRIFPNTILKRAAELDLETTRKGVRFATSVGGTLTGRGGNIVVIDDPMKPQEAMSEVKRLAVQQWYDGTLYSRLDSKKDDVIILVMQRLHVDDLVAHVLEKEHWVHLDLPAIAECSQAFALGDGRRFHRKFGDVLHPEREPAAVLDAIKATIGSFNFSAQYQQRPAPEEGNLVKWSWFRTYDHLPAIGAEGRIIQSWDTASKAGELNDYSVCTTWLKLGDDYYLMDVTRERLEYPYLKKLVVALARKFDAHTVVVEDKGSGTQLIQDLRRERIGIRPIGFKPDADKVTRMSNQSAKIEAGHVWLPREAPWLGDFKEEMLAFPYGRFDDQVDSVSQFIAWVEWKKRNTVRFGRAIGTY